MKVFILAGEMSGDKLGGALMEGLRSLDPDVSFEGVGGPQMAAQGLQSRFDMSELSVMGLAEILPKYRALKARIRQTADAILAQKPDVMITIDSPDFSLRVAKLVKAQSDIRTVHYVAPSVWAWRAGRAQKMARVINHVLALLPFEPPYMQDAGMACDFVGHPVVAEPVASENDVKLFKQAYDIEDKKTLLVLPGSRHGEVKRLAPIFGAALEKILSAQPGLQIIVPAALPVAEAVQEAVKSWPGTPIVLDPRDMSLDDATAQKRAAFRAADLALAASGTVSLELAAAQTPMVIAYDMSWLSRLIISRMLKVDTVTLVNLVSDTRAVPEFIGKDCRPDQIAAGVLEVLANSQAQEQAMDLTMQRLGQGHEPPGLRAAKAVLARMKP